LNQEVTRIVIDKNTLKIQITHKYLKDDSANARVEEDNQLVYKVVAFINSTSSTDQ
jgi:hypothetical protein